MAENFWRVLSHIRLVAAVVAGLALVFPLNVEAADAGSPPAYDQSDTMPEAQHIILGQHIEGHVAFLKAELMITPAQEPLWKPVAAAMREDVRVMQDAEQQVASRMTDRETAIQYLHNREMFAKLRAQGEFQIPCGVPAAL